MILIFSIDSTDKNIYEYIRKGAKFETLIRNLVLLIIDDSQGRRVYPECICRVPVGDIFKETLEQNWNNENMRLYRQKIISHNLENWCNHNCIKGIVNKNFIKVL
ncbi:MAG: hypothetical protein V1674_05915 [Candidatus Omnitrophota bacterium]